MANVNGLGTGWTSLFQTDYSNLFNSTSTNKSTTSNMLGIDLGEYYSVTRGSYSKLIKTYYDKYGTEGSSKKEDTAEDTVAKTTLKSSANSLYEAMDALLATGKNSLFNKVESKDEESGATTMTYDTDKILKAVKNVVDAYNDMVKNSTEVDNTAVLRQTLHMINAVSANGSLLDDIGIKIGSDNKLSVDEEKFKNADMSNVKVLFNGSSSLGGKIQKAASTVYMNVNNSMGDRSRYTANGTLGKYGTGNILDSFL